MQEEREVNKITVRTSVKATRNHTINHLHTHNYNTWNSVYKCAQTYIVFMNFSHAD